MSLSRRELIRTAATTAATAAVAAGATSFAPFAAAAAPAAADAPAGTKPADAKPATTGATTRTKREKPFVAVIGCGGMMRYHGNFIPKYGEVVALCDVDRGRADKYNAEVAGGKAAIEKHYEKVLSRPEIDCVFIGTPDHWHTKIAADALRAGKDIYCEKPVTLTLEEGRFLCDVARKAGRVFQVGTQQRSQDLFLKAVALAHAGRLGTIRRATVVIGPTPPGHDFAKSAPPPELDWDLWLGQAPKVDYIKQRCHNDFRWWYEYSGGRITDWGAHHVDIAQWAIAPDLPGPMEIEPLMVELPVPYSNGDPKVDNSFNTATRFILRYSFANGAEMILRDKVQGFPSDNGIRLDGDDGWLFVNREKLYGPAVDTLKDKPLPPGLVPHVDTSVQLDHEKHVKDFFECVKDRSRSVRSDIYTHVRMLASCHLGNIACRVGRKLKWDATAQEIVGDPMANAMQSRPLRAGFEIA
jgi:predicted dehydrogenase